jgi:DNA invertase Pin-like site-specific DNA recombinase
MKYGYCRISTEDQNVGLQLAAQKKVGCKTVFKDEGISGAISKRPALSRCLKKLEYGDTLVVWTFHGLFQTVEEALKDLSTWGVVIPGRERAQRGEPLLQLTEPILNNND